MFASAAANSSKRAWSPREIAGDAAGTIAEERHRPASRLPSSFEAPHLCFSSRRIFSLALGAVGNRFGCSDTRSRNTVRTDCWFRSADRGWSGLSAQLRSHGSGVIAWNNAQPDVELCVDVRGSRSVVTRRGGGIVNRARAERGTIWLSPAGLKEDFIDISGPLPGMLHLYLPSNCFPPQSSAPMPITSCRSHSATRAHSRTRLSPRSPLRFSLNLKPKPLPVLCLPRHSAFSLAARLVQNHLGTLHLRRGRPSQDSIAAGSFGCWITSTVTWKVISTVEHLASIACLSRSISPGL